MTTAIFATYIVFCSMMASEPMSVGASSPLPKLLASRPYPSSVSFGASSLPDGILVAAGESASGRPKNRVLLVHSYWTDFSQVNDITAGVRSALSNENVDLRVFYMDTKRKTSEEWKRRAGELARQEVDAFGPDVVITADDNAQIYFAQDYANVPGAPQFVFCGVNAEVREYGYPASNITGILERDHVVQSLQLLLRIVPGVKTAAVLADAAPTTDFVIKYMQSLNSPIELVAYHRCQDFSEWKEKVAYYQDKVDALVTNNYRAIRTVRDSEVSMAPEDVMAWTLDHNRLPTVCFNGPSVDEGVLCGISGSGMEHGFEAARIAKALLEGKKASDFPISPAKKGIILLNLKTAEKLGIDVPYSVIRLADEVIKYR